MDRNLLTIIATLMILSSFGVAMIAFEMMKKERRNRE